MALLVREGRLALEGMSLDFYFSLLDYKKGVLSYIDFNDACNGIGRKEGVNGRKRVPCRKAKA